MFVMAIGKPGEHARICEFSSMADLPQKIRPGEVAVPATVGAKGKIADDGSCFVDHVASLAEVQRDRWQEAKAFRRKRMTGGVAVDIDGVARVFDTRDDTLKPSQRLIEQAAGEALRAIVRGLPFSKEFTLADNTRLTLDAEQMMAVGDAVVANNQACQDAGNAIRDQIYAPGIDEAGVAAVDITAGYPPLPA